MEWQSLAYRPLYHLLAEHLAEKISSGHFPQDAHLPPLRTIMDLFGVSQVTARKAIALLEAEGRVKAFHGSGIRVIRGPAAAHRTAPEPALDPRAEVSDLFAVRLALEPAALVNALPRIDLPALRQLQALSGSGAEGVHRFDAKLHEEIFAKCTNAYLRQPLAEVMRRITLYRELNFRTQAEDPAIDRHEVAAVVDAIAAADAEAAARALVDHIRSTLAGILAVITRQRPARKGRR